MVTLGVFRGDWLRRSEIKLELRNGVNFPKVNPGKSPLLFDSEWNRTFFIPKKYLNPQKIFS